MVKKVLLTLILLACLTGCKETHKIPTRYQPAPTASEIPTRYQPAPTG